MTPMMRWKKERAAGNARGKPPRCGNCANCRTAAVSKQGCLTNMHTPGSVLTLRGRDSIGTRIRVRWVEGHYDATVAAYDADKGTFLVVYDDDHVLWEKLWKCDVDILDLPRGAVGSVARVAGRDASVLVVEERGDRVRFVDLDDLTESVKNKLFHAEVREAGAAELIL